MLQRLRDKYFETWLPGYARHVARASLQERASGTRHLLFCFCDHFEPLWGGADKGLGLARVDKWLSDYPKMIDGFVDADGKKPQHSFFFPGEEYRPEFFDRIDQLVRQGCGEVELHMHHDDATEASMRAELEQYLKTYAERGHFSRAPDGRPRYAFIHGNWALANGRPDGTRCGIDRELPLLFSTGCYADFTFPSCPDVSQPNLVNQIYWPTGDMGRRRAYENGTRARVGESYRDRMLMIQGPLGFAKRPGRMSLRIENGAVTADDPATASRVHSWAGQNIVVDGRPDWVFVKVYTHGAPDKQAASLLSDHGRSMHRALREHYNDGRSWKLHYVTAREMYNVAKAALAGKSGDPNDYRDFELSPPPILSGLSG
ncbi:MAG: hypothetical protein HRU17_12530 [Polyangiaceae bacterium]|nr:hypothetical protein [Polyangiaceae bacterium]